MLKKTLALAAIFLGLKSFGFAQEELDAKTERCHILNSQIFHWRADYFEDARFNDSVIEAANEGLAISAPESFFEQDFTFHLVEAYVRAKRYDDALDIAHRHHEVIENFYPYHYNMLYDEVMVVKCHSAGDIEQRNIYLERMIAAMGPYLKKHRRRIDFLCRVEDFSGNISKYHKEIRLWSTNTHYYYFRLLIDPVNTRQELCAKKYSKEFIDYVEHSVKCVAFFDCNSNVNPEQ